MSDQYKKQRVCLGVFKQSQYGWFGKLGLSDVSINYSKTNPTDLVVYLVERPRYENKGYGNQSQRSQPPQRQQQYRPPQRPQNHAPRQEPPPEYEAGDPGPQNEYEPESGDLPF